MFWFSVRKLEKAAECNENNKNNFFILKIIKVILYWENNFLGQTQVYLFEAKLFRLDPKPNPTWRLNMSTSDGSHHTKAIDGDRHTMDKSPLLQIEAQQCLLFVWERRRKAMRERRRRRRVWRVTTNIVSLWCLDYKASTDCSLVCKLFLDCIVPWCVDCSFLSLQCDLVFLTVGGGWVRARIKNPESEEILADRR